MSPLRRRALFVTCLIAMASFTVSCGVRQRSTPDSAWLRDNWAAGLLFATSVQPLRLGTMYSAAEAIRPQAVPVRFVGLSEPVGQWQLEYYFPEGRRSEPRLTMEDWQAPDTDAPLTSVSGTSRRKVARDAEAEWIGIVKRWRHGGILVRCWAYRDLGVGTYAIASHAADTAVAYFQALEQGWEGPPFDEKAVSPLGVVAVEVSSRVHPAFYRNRGSSIRCP